jgi:hypothetical protein
MVVRVKRDPINVPLLESEARLWVRSCLKDRGEMGNWQEPRSGGTMGAPDVWLQQRAGGRIGVELKVGWPDEEYVRFTMRPAQIRYHHVAAQSGDRTAILVTVVHDNKLLWRALLPGNMCPKSTDARVKCSSMLDVRSWEDFTTAINCDGLWAAE